MAKNKFRSEARHYRRGDEPYLRPLDRNDRARILFLAEAYDRRTREPGQHGGQIKRTGIAVLRALLCRYMNLGTGRCDPSAEAIARASGVARSTVFTALDRLEVAGLVKRHQRLVTHGKKGNWQTTQATNAYTFNFPADTRRDEGDLEMPLLDSRRKGPGSPPPRVQNSIGNQHPFYKNAGANGNLSTGSGN